SRKQDAVEAVAEAFKADGLEAVGIACHVGQADQREALVEKTIEHYGKVDILINNAATNPYFGPIDQMTEEIYKKTMQINLDAALFMSNLVYPTMKQNGGGSIIHISSIEGLHASAGFAAYNLSKAALVMLAKNQAAEWGSDNVRVNVICPGLVKTKLSQMLWKNEAILRKAEKTIPMKRMAQPDEMAGLAVFLASDAASYMTGATLVNDGGILNGGLF
ncbi:MAG: SDR family oxidoreductase, partial [Bacteroidota bacterium]